MKDGDQIKLHVDPVGGTEVHQIDGLGMKDRLTAFKRTLIHLGYRSEGAPNIPADKPIAACQEIPQIPQSMKIKVGNADSYKVLEVRISSITPMGKLMSYVCKQWQVPEGTARFMVDGHRIREQETASVVSKVLFRSELGFKYERIMD